MITYSISLITETAPYVPRLASALPWYAKWLSAAGFVTLVVEMSFYAYFVWRVITWLEKRSINTCNT